MAAEDGLKAQKLLAQGIALDIIAISKTPCKGVLDVTYDTPSFYFFLMSVKPSRSGRMTTSTLGSLAIRSLNARMPLV